MARQRLSIDLVTHHSIALVDREGFEALSLSAVADALGVGPSALYSHVDGLDGLRHLVAVTATGNLTQQVQAAATGTAGPVALGAMGGAYRNFALGHPGQFASTLRPPPDDSDALAEANQALLEIFALVYGGMGLASSDAQLAARSTRSAIHGFLALEHTTGTTPTHDAEYAHLLETLQRGVTHADCDG